MNQWKNKYMKEQLLIEKAISKYIQDVRSWERLLMEIRRYIFVRDAFWVILPQFWVLVIVATFRLAHHWSADLAKNPFPLSFHPIALMYEIILLVYVFKIHFKLREKYILFVSLYFFITWCRVFLIRSSLQPIYPFILYSTFNLYFPFLVILKDTSSSHSKFGTEKETMR